MDKIIIERLKSTENGMIWVSEVEEMDTEGDFAIDEMNIDKEICRMGKLLLRYGDVAAEMGAMLKRKEEEVKQFHAKWSAYHRSKAESGNTKITVAELNEKVINQKEYNTILFNLHLCRADALKTDHWWRSIQKKADMLNALAFKQRAEYKHTS